MPNRIIKESVCVSASIDKLTWFEEVLFYRLIVNCDDYGRFDGRVSVIKNRLFPLKDNVTTKAVTEAINKLVSVELVVLYEFEGKPYLHLPTWNEHQSIRAKRSKYPAPDDSVKSHEIICKHVQADVPVIQSESESYSKSESKTSAGFDTFWEQYPRHTAKEAARKAWSKLNPSAELQEQIIAAVLVYKSSPQWTKDGGQYIPHPSTFLNQRRWEDEIVGSSEDYYQRLFNQFAEEEANE